MKQLVSIDQFHILTEKTMLLQRHVSNSILIPQTTKHTVPLNKRSKKSEILVTEKSCITLEA